MKKQDIIIGNWSLSRKDMTCVLLKALHYVLIFSLIAIIIITFILLGKKNNSLGMITKK